MNQINKVGALNYPPGAGKFPINNLQSRMEDQIVRGKEIPSRMLPETRKNISGYANIGVLASAAGILGSTLLAGHIASIGCGVLGAVLGGLLGGRIGEKYIGEIVDSGIPGASYMCGIIGAGIGAAIGGIAGATVCSL